MRRFFGNYYLFTFAHRFYIMKISELQSVYAGHPNAKAFEAFVVKKTVRNVFLHGLCASAAPLFLSGILRKMTSPVVCVLNDLEDAGYFYHDLTQINGEADVLFFPSSYRRAVKYGQKDPANGILRTEALSRLWHVTGNVCVVTYPEALAEKVVSKKNLSRKTLILHEGERCDPVEVGNALFAWGFEHVDYVYEPGQYAVRGSIIDVFSFSSEYPYRIDFFGDEIDSIRSFEVESQLSKDRKGRIAIVPEPDSCGGEEVSLFEFLADDAFLWFKDFAWVRERIEAVHNEAVSPQAAVACAAEGGLDKVRIPATVDGKEFVREALRFRKVEFGVKATGVPDAKLEFDVALQPVFHKNFDLVGSVLKDYQARKYRIYILSDSQKQTDRIKAVFDERGDDIGFVPVDRTLHEGFVDQTLKACFFTDHQIFDRFHKYNLRSDKARGGKAALSLKELSQFEPGDYVVHIDHGVGRFAGLVRIPNGNSTQEVIRLVYQNDDVVFVSIHALHKISRYKGREGEAPRLSRLGTGAWERLKERTKSRIKDIARDLIRLYARRREEKGFSFSPDSFLQHELEASFIYEDTPDQLKAVQEVKADMEKDRPMDRLVCGDVGFGKTEVAVRAAFKAVCDNKQVAVLVPTTVLAYQHYCTLRDRLKGFPCKVGYLSRARKPSDVRRMLKELKEGGLDIVVGTHRIIGKDVVFKDLGLLVIDEEQKFGVAVKERLRQLKVNVDTLAMTATPIPRTLQFSLMGVRDMSVIQTPPPNRYPVQTEVHVFNEDIIAEAVNFEMSRNGQVFFVNNRIDDLEELKAMVLRLVPDARVCVGHGQMRPDKLEKVILGFVNYDYDVLITTTIIENGIDIPNANTIIINHAQNFGLSDLHQMRGRVGRSDRKAFCYLLAPPLSGLPAESRRRLQAIENFSGLGSGIHIAMQDLDIRGAGNLLGAEQSGFIADLGYETYQKILTEAVTELKSDEFESLYAGDRKPGGKEFVNECTVESDMELLFPDEYVPGSGERMSLYRELDGLELDKDVEAYRKRLEDRFGKLPPESEELLEIVPLRRLGKHLGAERIYLKSGRMTLFFVSNPDSMYYQSDAFGKIISYMGRYPELCSLREQNGKRGMVIRDVGTVYRGVAVLKEIAGMEG